MKGTGRRREGEGGSGGEVKGCEGRVRVPVCNCVMHKFAPGNDFSY